VADVYRVPTAAAWKSITMRPLTRANCGMFFIFSCSALAGEAVMSFPFLFAPGWANGWPGGLTIYQVWSTWLSLTLFVMMMTVGVGVGSLVSLFASIFPGARRHTGNVLGIFVVIWSMLSLAICSFAFREIYASTLEMWPNGYPG
jgi:hypothetical protein